MSELCHDSTDNESMERYEYEEDDDERNEIRDVSMDKHSILANK